MTATAAQNQLLSFRLFPSSLASSVKILPSDARLTEAGDGGSFTVVRTGDLSQPLNVPYTVGGAATAGSDYEALSGTVTIPAGANSAVILLRPLADSVVESQETITVTLTAQPGVPSRTVEERNRSDRRQRSGEAAAARAPTGLYPFSEGTGGATADLSGNGNNGTVTAATWVPGKYGQGLQFNGSTSFVSVPDAGSLDIGSTGTIEAWVSLAAVNRWHGIVAKGSANSGAAHNYALEVNSGNRVECLVGNGGVVERRLSRRPRLSAGTLYHLACVWTGSQLQLYVNGTLNATAFQSLTPLGNARRCPSASSAAMPIGPTASSTRCRISNQARTQAQIQSDMNNPIAGPPPARTRQSRRSPSQRRRQVPVSPEPCRSLPTPPTTSAWRASSSRSTARISARKTRLRRTRSPGTRARRRTARTAWPRLPGTRPATGRPPPP